MKQLSCKYKIYLVRDLPLRNLSEVVKILSQEKAIGLNNSEQSIVN